MPHDFAYSDKDDYSGTNFNHRGTYNVDHPDGRKKTVGDYITMNRIFIYYIQICQ